MTSIAAAIAVVVPLAFDPGGYLVFLPIKWTLAVTLASAGVGLVLVRCRGLPSAPGQRTWGVLLAAIVASAVVGAGGIVGWVGAPGRYLGVAAWLAFACAWVVGAAIEPVKRIVVARAATSASIAVSAYAALQALGIDPVEWNETLNLTRVRSTLGNAAFLGAYLTMVVPLAALLAMTPTEAKRWRIVHGVAAALGIAAVLATQTRGAWLGIVAAGILMTILKLRTLRSRPVVASAVAVGVVAAIVLLATVSPLSQRIQSTADPRSATGRGRLMQWEHTIDLIASRPALGWGPESYSFAFPRYIDARFERTVGRDVIPDRAHNVFLDIASTSGIVGTLAYLALLASMGIAVVRRRERDSMTVALSAACIGYLVQSQFSFPLADLDVVFWLFAGMLLAPATGLGRRHSGAWAAIPMLAALVVAAWGASDIVADHRLRNALEAESRGELGTAQTLVDAAAGPALGRYQYQQAAGRLHRRVGEISKRPADFARSRAAIVDALGIAPSDLELALDDADTLLAWAEATDDRSRIERAARAYERVLALDRFSSRVHLKVGVAYVELGREDAAERAWLSAADLAPRSPAPLDNLAHLYRLQGRAEEAERMERRARDLG